MAEIEASVEQLKAAYRDAKDLDKQASEHFRSCCLNVLETIRLDNLQLAETEGILLQSK